MIAVLRWFLLTFFGRWVRPAPAMVPAKSAVPEGMTTITPKLTCKDGPKAVAFYQQAFGAEVLYQQLTPDGSRLAYARLRIGTAWLIVTDAFPEFRWSIPPDEPPSETSGTNAAQSADDPYNPPELPLSEPPVPPVMLHLQVDDAREVYRRAHEAGCERVMPIIDTFWGNIEGILRDPWGHEWAIGQQVYEPTQFEEPDPRDLPPLKQTPRDIPAPHGATGGS